MLNIITNQEQQGAAVLIRAAEPVKGTPSRHFRGMLVGWATAPPLLPFLMCSYAVYIFSSACPCV